MLEPCADHDRWMGGCAACEGATRRAEERTRDRDKAELDRLRLVERVCRGLTSPEARSLACAAIEAYEGHQTNLPPGPWSDVKARLLEAAFAFGKMAK